MNENQTNNTKEIHPKKSRERSEGSKRKRVKPSNGPCEEATLRIDPILKVGYDLLNQLKGFMGEMIAKDKARDCIEEQVFTSSLAIIGWLNQQVTLRYALAVQNYRGNAMASHLVSIQDQGDTQPKAQRMPGPRSTAVAVVPPDEKRKKIAQMALHEHGEDMRAHIPRPPAHIPEPVALSDEEMAIKLHREMNVQPFLRAHERKEKLADPVASGINEQLAMLVEKITGFKCDQYGSRSI